MESIFGKDGFLKEIIDNFEYRDEQVNMAEFIMERLFENENGLIEAGTGTGKTLAYLLPALRYALESDKKISITTETKALQKQLIDKDLPIIKKIFKEHLDVDFNYSLCLGSSNYPCRKRYEIIIKRGKFSPTDLKKITGLNDLFSKQKVFTRFDVNLPNYLWNEINREPDGCNTFRCAFASNCQFINAKKEWMKSHVLVMNHYLFFANIASGKVYLPETDVAIFDEAHSVEDIASAQLGFSLGYRQLMEILERFHYRKRRNTLISNFKKVDLKRRSIEKLEEVSREANNFFEKIREFFSSKVNHFRVREQLQFGHGFVKPLKEFLLYVNDAEDDFEDEYLKMEYDIARSMVFMYIENLTSFIYMNDEDFVYWVERSEKELLGDIFLKGQPVNISEIMREQVLSYYKSSIFVSATLAIDNNFSFIEKRLGLEGAKSVSLSSTFDHRSQMILYVAADMPAPNSEEFFPKSADAAAKIINHLGGNCLILFTSYRALGAVKKILKKLIDFPIYSQDEYTSAEAVELYINDDNSVLMGTHSFWQGIDLPGDLLRGVVMMRLPFSVPDSPIIEAKIERVTEQGKNAFFSFQVPDAAIKFKQGFGRLIRSQEDRGIVAMLDSRIHTKSYGKRFLKVLPQCRIVYSIDDLKKEYEML